MRTEYYALTLISDIDEPIQPKQSTANSDNDLWAMWDRDISMLVEFGFTPEQCFKALTETVSNLNIDGLLEERRP